MSSLEISLNEFHEEVIALSTWVTTLGNCMVSSVKLSLGGVSPSVVPDRKKPLHSQRNDKPSFGQC